MAVPERKRKQSERDIQQAIGMLRSMEDPSKCHQVTVQDPVKVGITRELKDHLKECEIVLERIDQELLELGPFAKDNFLPLKEEPIAVASPPSLAIGGGGGTSRRSRKGQRSSYSGGVTGNRGGSTKEMLPYRGAGPSSSCPVSVPSSSVAADDKMTSSSSAPKVNDGSKNLLPRGKWRKIGSAGSPIVPSPTSHLPPKKPSTSHPYAASTGSPGTDSRELPPLGPQPVARPPPSKPVKGQEGGGRGKGGSSTDIDSPSMIPAASEIEMLSLYMPNSQWETIESSPLQPDHGSQHAEVSSGRQGVQPLQRDPPPLHPSSSVARSIQQNFATEVLSRVDHTPVQSLSSSLSCDLESTTGGGGERAHGHIDLNAVSASSHSGAAVAPTTTAGSWPSPLTTSVARHSHKQANLATSGSEHMRYEAGHSIGGYAQMGELRRHIVVKDGAPVVTKPNFSVGHLVTVGTGCSTSSPSSSSVYHQSATPPFYPPLIRDTRSATPIDRSSVTSPAGTGGSHMTHGSAPAQGPPHLTSDINSPTYIKQRRSSSSSSLRSTKQMDERKQPTPPSHHQRGPSSTSPLQMSQQQMQFMGGKLYNVYIVKCRFKNQYS